MYLGQKSDASVSANGVTPGGNRDLAPAVIPASSRGAGDPFDDERPLDLTSGRRAWELVDELDPSRLLVRREPVAAVRPQDLDIDLAGAARPSHHDGAHDLAPLHIGDADDGDFEDRRVVPQRILDLERRDRLAAGTEHIARATDDGEVALVVERPEIARVVPAVLERVGGGVGLFEVPVHQEVAR